MNLLDMLGKCPGCGRDVAYPFTVTMDVRVPLEPGGERAKGTRPTSDEMEVLGTAGMGGAREVSGRIPTVMNGKELWHAPCWNKHKQENK